MSDAQKTGWRPIDTAPKDGSEILLGVDWEPLRVVGYWSDDAGDWCVKGDREPLSPGFAPLTHWMPLEELPHAE